MSRTGRVIVGSGTLLAIGIGIALFLRPSRSLSPMAELPAPAHLPPALRLAIKGKMVRHGEQMTALLGGVLALDYDRAARQAGAIFDEPALARPVADEDLNQALPPRFFQLQDDIRHQAREIAAAAARRDGKDLARQTGRMVETCVSCHQVYLDEQPDQVSTSNEPR